MSRPKPEMPLTFEQNLPTGSSPDPTANNQPNNTQVSETDQNY